MYHLEKEEEYLNTPYYRKTFSLCPECLERIPAEILEENNEIFMKKLAQNTVSFKTNCLRTQSIISGRIILGKTRMAK